MRKASLLLRSVLLAALLCAGCTAPLLAQSTVPALLLSDIHFDPFHDPAKVARLNRAPVSGWSAILAEADSSGLTEAAARLNQACPTHGSDTPDSLWRSSLQAVRTGTSTARPRFVTISGDLLAHAFDCKYKALLPSTTHADYVAFTEKTLRYVLLGLRTALPDTPIYPALGNNDSGCTDYQLSATHDEFLALAAKITAELLPVSVLDPHDRAELLATFSEVGAYSASLASVPNTRILVLDDLFLSPRYTTCGGAPDRKPAAAQLAWLAAQLAAAREHSQRVWILGHIPPGVDLYTTARKLIDVCGGGKPVTFLASNQLAATLAANAGTVRLALFGHTHSDEMRLLEAPGQSAGVPVKLTGSITPLHGNLPTFTLAMVDPVTADLKDFTVYRASNATGIAANWSPEYTYSTTFHQTAFDGSALRTLISGLQADPAAQSEASQAYLRNYIPGDLSDLLQLVWPEYTCSMDHTSPESFAACICAVKPQRSQPSSF